MTTAASGTGVRVCLRAAPVPVVGALADHHWLVVEHGTHRERWEVWQRRDVGGTSWGHLHRDLLTHDAGVGAGASRVLRVFEEPWAAVLCERILRSPQDYPWCGRYRLLPGPNSNTFVQWALGDLHHLGMRGWGRGYARHAG